MFELAESFWMQHVDARVPPKDPVQTMLEAPKVTDGVLEGELLEYVTQYADLQSQKDNLELAIAEMRTRLMGTAATPGTWQGNGYKLSFTMQPGKKTISKSKLEAAGIDTEPYLTVGKPYPVISVKQLRKEL
jgi:hypothetical protein